MKPKRDDNMIDHGKIKCYTRIYKVHGISLAFGTFLLHFILDHNKN